MRREAMMLRTILASPKLDKDKLKEYLIRLMYVEMLDTTRRSGTSTP